MLVNVAGFSENGDTACRSSVFDLAQLSDCKIYLRSFNKENSSEDCFHVIEPKWSEYFAVQQTCSAATISGDRTTLIERVKMSLVKSNGCRQNTIGGQVFISETALERRVMETNLHSFVIRRHGNTGCGSECDGIMLRNDS